MEVRYIGVSLVFYVAMWRDNAKLVKGTHLYDNLKLWLSENYCKAAFSNEISCSKGCILDGMIHSFQKIKLRPQWRHQIALLTRLECFGISCSSSTSNSKVNKINLFFDRPLTPMWTFFMYSNIGRLFSSHWCLSVFSGTNLQQVSSNVISKQFEWA